MTCSNPLAARRECQPPSKAGGLLGSFELDGGLKEEQLGTEADGAVVGGRGGGFHLFINIFILG